MYTSAQISNKVSLLTHKQLTKTCLHVITYYFTLVKLSFVFTVPIIGVHAFRLLMQLTAPIMVGKTIISFIHLMDASYRIVAVDAEEKSSASMKSS